MSHLTSDAIALGSLQGALDAVRRNAAEAFSDAQKLDQAPSQMRATLSNLIFVVCEPCAQLDTSKINAVIDTLCVTHPSRFFVLRCHANAEQALTASVQSRCVKARSGIGVCSEEVYLNVNAGDSAVVPNVLLSLLVPDIDTVLLLLHEPSEIEHAGFLPMVTHLASMVDVIMYDSASFGEYERGITSVLDLLSEDPATGFTGAIARDISWLRVQRWQELVVEQFLSQQFVEDVGSIREVSVTQINSQTSQGVLPETALFLGWCLDCLKWELDSANKESEGVLTVSCRSEAGHKTSLRIETKVTQEPPAAGERLQAVEISADAGAEGTMHVAISRVAKIDSAELTVSVSAEGSGSSQSCDFYTRRVPFKMPLYEDIIASRIGTQRVHSQRERSIQLAKQLAATVNRIRP